MVKNIINGINKAACISTVGRLTFNLDYHRAFLILNFGNGIISEIIIENQRRLAVDFRVCGKFLGSLPKKRRGISVRKCPEPDFRRKSANVVKTITKAEKFKEFVNSSFEKTKSKRKFVGGRRDRCQWPNPRIRRRSRFEGFRSFEKLSQVNIDGMWFFGLVTSPKCNLRGVRSWIGMADAQKQAVVPDTKPMKFNKYQAERAAEWISMKRKGDEISKEDYYPWNFDDKLLFRWKKEHKKLHYYVIILRNIGVGPNEAALAPFKYQIDDFVSSEQFLGLPPEVIAAIGVTNKDNTQRLVGNQIFPKGLNQKFELTITSHVELNMQLLYGDDQVMTFGHGKAKWEAILPGRRMWNRYIAKGYVTDLGLPNKIIANAMVKAGYVIQNNMVYTQKLSTDGGSIAGHNVAMHYRYCYPLEVKEIKDGEFAKMEVEVHSRKKGPLKLLFTVEERAAEADVERKCRVCFREDCTGVDQAVCDYTGQNVEQHVKQMEDKRKANPSYNEAKRADEVFGETTRMYLRMITEHQKLGRVRELLARVMSAGLESKTPLEPPKAPSPSYAAAAGPSRPPSETRPKVAEVRRTGPSRGGTYFIALTTRQNYESLKIEDLRAGLLKMPIPSNASSVASIIMEHFNLGQLIQMAIRLGILTNDEFAKMATVSVPGQKSKIAEILAKEIFKSE